MINKRKASSALDNKTLVNYYCFEVMYKSRSVISKEENINTDLIYNVADIPTAITGIYRVEHGSKYINTSGEIRDII